MLNEPFKLIKNITKLKNNSYYLGIIQDLYSGSEGEIVSFLQFFYQMNVSSLFNEALSETFFKIAIDELENAHKLSILIQLLNGNPIYATTNGKWLGGRSIDYIRNFKEMIELNIELKNKKIIDIKMAISKIDDLKIKNILTEILEKEKEHKIILQKLKIKINNY